MCVVYPSPVTHHPSPTKRRPLGRSPPRDWVEGLKRRCTIHAKPAHPRGTWHARPTGGRPVPSGGGTVHGRAAAGGIEGCDGAFTILKSHTICKRKRPSLPSPPALRPVSLPNGGGAHRRRRRRRHTAPPGPPVRPTTNLSMCPFPSPLHSTEGPAPSLAPYPSAGFRGGRCQGHVAAPPPTERGYRYRCRCLAPRSASVGIGYCFV